MKKESICTQIANYIIQNNDKKNHSLFYGNTGIAIIFYKLGVALKKPEYSKYGDLLLDEIFSSLSEKTNINFVSGLSGIGWGINYILKQGYVEGDPNDILLEIDQKIYIDLTNTKEDIKLWFSEGLIGILIYLKDRLRNKNQTISSHQINLELFKYQINKIDQSFLKCYSMIYNDCVFDLFRDFPILFNILADSISENIYCDKIKNMVNHWVPTIISYIPGIHLNRISLILSLSKLNQHLKNADLEEYIGMLIYSINMQKIGSEFFHNQCWLQKGNIGVLYILNSFSKYIIKEDSKMQECKELKKKITQSTLLELQDIISNPQNIPIDLANGLCGSLLLFLEEEQINI